MNLDLLGHWEQLCLSLSQWLNHQRPGQLAHRLQHPGSLLGRHRWPKEVQNQQPRLCCGWEGWRCDSLDSSMIDMILAEGVDVQPIQFQTSYG